MLKANKQDQKFSQRTGQIFSSIEVIPLTLGYFGSALFCGKVGAGCSFDGGWGRGN